ncbi:MAG: ABC transporter substrate-binding protein [Kordiimonadaceae bacterium]|nr:ABC transporter substrate-binding protein [Kordiimonadaceae bacterium]
MIAVAKIRCSIISALFATVASCYSSYTFAGELPKAVSLDFCADQYLLAIADPAQIIAVSKYATDENSFYRDRATGLKQYGGTVEEILMMKPDVVLGTDWSFMIQPALKNYGIETDTPQYGYETDILLKNLEHFGKVLHRNQQAEKIKSDYIARLSSLENLPKSDIRAAYITPSGFTGGTGTYIDNIIKLAGFKSLAEENGTIDWQPLSLEKLLMNPPDLIITSFFGQTDVEVSHWSLTRHPEIQKIMAEIPTVSIPSDMISCGSLFSIEIADYIHDEGEKALQSKDRTRNGN